MLTDYKAPQVSSFFHECYLSLSPPPISEGRTWYMCVCYYDGRGVHGPQLFYSHQQELLEHNGALICAMDTVSMSCLHLSVGLRTTCLKSVGCSG